MTYAIIKTGGKQIKVSTGDSIWIEKINGVDGDQITFDQVLAIFDGEKLHFGKPFIKGSVIGTLTKQGKHPKIRILRFKNKSNWERRQGHRQPYTRLFINEIFLDGKSISKTLINSKPHHITKSKINEEKLLEVIENKSVENKQIETIEVIDTKE